MDTLNPNKRLKEEFVSNLTGSSFLEISALATLVPVLMLLRHSIYSDRDLECKSKKNDDPIVASKSCSDYMTMLLADFLFIVFPTLLLLTVLAEEIYRWVFMMAFLLLFRAFFKRSNSQSTSFSDSPLSLRENISSYRVSLMIITILSILAVDFTIFPRRYGKAETYGSSLMDVGVGSFVLANSLVSRQARNVSSVKLKNAVKSTSPLIILGLARLLSTRSVDYQVHVGEYGVHWNFFFTLAAIALLTSLINVPPKYCGLLGAVILVGYQICLMRGWNTYLLSDKRGPDLISQNKEGIFSIFGYWGLYLVGVQLGSFLFFQKDHVSKMRSNKWARTRVWILCLAFWLMTVLIDRHVERVSRRMCNLAYTTMVIAVNLQGIGTLMLSDFIPGSKSSILEQACNRNLLATFLLANILTGLVNMSTDTLFASPLKALSILTCYAFTLCAVIGSVDFHGFQLKVW